MKREKYQITKNNIFGFYKYTKQIYPDALRDIKALIIKRAIWSILSFPLTLIFETLNNYLYKINHRNIKVIFVGTYFPDLINTFNKNEIIIISHFKDGIKLSRNRIHWKSSEPLYLSLFVLTYFNKIILIKRWINFFSRFRNALLVTGNDTKPFERLLIQTCRNSQLKTITIQHGIWQGESNNKYVYDGWYTDIIAVYDEYHKSILIKKGMSLKKIQVIGFPKSYVKHNLSDRKKVVCFLGSGLSKTYKKTLVWDINQEIINALNSLSYKVFYKPHPSEIKYRLLEIDSNLVELYKRDLSQAIDEFDCFIGLQTTALLEVNLAGKIGIQVYDPKISGLNLEMAGYSYSIKIDDIDKLKDILANRKSYKTTFDENSLESVKEEIMAIITD